MKKSLLFSIIVFSCFFFECFESKAANKLDKASTIRFLEQYNTVINSAREESLNQFFRFYGSAQSKYVITSYYVDPDKNEDLISQEQREMNRDQFIKFVF